MDYTLLAAQFKKELEAQLDNELKPQFLFSLLGSDTTFQTEINLNQRVAASIRAALELDELTKEDSSVKPPHPLLPGLIIYICGALSPEPERAVPVAAVVEFLLRASCILDDIQDHDRPEALAAKLGDAQAQNIAMIMIQVGQANLVSALKALGLPADLCLDLISNLSRTIINSAKGQLLDLAEVNESFAEQINNFGYFQQKAALKTAATVGFLAYLGAVIGAGTKTQSASIYRDFGLSFGMVLHLINDLKDFVLGLENAGRDLKNRHLTLPLIYCFQELKSSKDRTTLIKLWSSTDLNESYHQELLNLLKSTLVLPQVLAQAVSYLVQAENALKLVDPNLEKLEHQMMIASLKDLLRQFQFYFSRFNGLNT